MSHSNRTSLPEGYLWGWNYTGARKPVASADPRMEVQPPGYDSFMPNVTTTPPPPNVWMANALEMPDPPNALGRPMVPWLHALNPGKNALLPGITDDRMTDEIWGRMTLEQRARYDHAFQAYMSAMSNERYLQAPQRPSQFDDPGYADNRLLNGEVRAAYDDPRWAERYPGF